MMKYAPVVALALAGALVAGCGGGGITKDELTEVEKDLAKAEQERDAAKKEAEEQRKKAAQAEADRKKAAQEAAAAEEQRKKEQEALAEAEKQKKELEEEARHTANQLRQANARRLLVGLNGFLTDGNTTNTIDRDPEVTPRYRASALVSTETGTDAYPAVTFSSITTGTSGRWFRTSLSHPGATNTTTDRIDVYSDAEAPDHVPFRDSVYNDGTSGDNIPNTSDAISVVRLYGATTGDAPTMVVDNQNELVGSLQIGDTNGRNVSYAAASPFPKSGDPAKSFTLVDRGYYTRTEINLGKEWHRLTNDTDNTNDPTLPSHCGTACDASGFPTVSENPRTVRNDDRYPLRYTYEASGSLSGASGTYTCASADTTPSCRVTNQNNHFRFVGPWFFTPSSASARVRVEDAESMYFGWWARQDNTDGSWAFRTFDGPTGINAAGNRSSADEITQLAGTATYQGPAVGHYAFYQPEAGQLRGHSEYGEFTARATLTANFTVAGDGGDETVSGTIDQFDGHSDWTLTLKQTAIDANGVIPSGSNTVSWKIDGEAFAAPDSGTWEAAFYSDQPDSKRGGDGNPDEDAVPTGMAGTFEAKYHQAGAIIGAFGAHKQP